MAEMLVDDPRKKLYSALVSSSDKELAGQVKKYSYNKFNSLLDNNDFVQDLFMDVSERGVILDPKNPESSKDPYQFVNAFVYKAPPAPKKQPAPVAPPLVEEEPYVPEPQPAVGSPEYDKQLQKQYGGMAPTLGATFGGVPAAFETKEQKKQEQISPAFKAQKLAFEDVPIAEEQRRAQKQFAKSIKEQQQIEQQEPKGFFEGLGTQVKRGLAQGRAIQSVNMEQLRDAAQGKNLDAIPYEQIAAANKAVKEFGQTQSDIDLATKEGWIKDAWDVVKALPGVTIESLASLGRSGIEEAVVGATTGAAAGTTVLPGLGTAAGAGIGGAASMVQTGRNLEYFSTLMQELEAKGIDITDPAKLKYGIATYGKDADKTAITRANTIAIAESSLPIIGEITGSIASRIGSQIAKKPLQAISKGLTYEPIAGPLGGATGELAAQIASGQEIDPQAIALETGGEGAATVAAIARAIKGEKKITDKVIGKIDKQSKIAQAMEEAVRANPEAEGQIRQQYQKRINEAAPKDEEVLSAYKSLSALPETEEKNTIRENLEAYMAEKGIAPQEEVETVSAEELQGPGYQIAYAKTREEIPQEYRGTIAEVERPTTRLGRFGPMEKVFAYRVPTETIDITAPEVTTEEDLAEEIPFEEVPAVTEEATAEEVAPATGMFEGLQGPTEEEAALLAQEETAPVAPAEEEGLQPGERRIGGAIVKTGYVPTLAVRPSQQAVEQQPPTTTPPTPTGIPAPFVPSVSFGDIKLSPQKHIGETIAVEHNGEQKDYTITKVGMDYVLVTDENGDRINIPLYEWSRNVNEPSALAEPVAPEVAPEIVSAAPVASEIEKQNTFTRDDLKTISKGTALAKKGAEVMSPEKVESQLRPGDEVTFFAERERKGVWDGKMIREVGTDNPWGVMGILADVNGFIRNDTKINEQAVPVEEVAPEAPAAPAPKGRKKKEALVQKPKREDFPESQTNTRTPVTQKLLDYFADAFGIPRFTEDLSKGTYIKWLQNANNTGYEVASKLNAPRQAFDIIAQAEKERSEVATPAPKAETKQKAPVTPAPAAPETKEGKKAEAKEEKGKVATKVEEYEGVFNPDKTGVAGIDELLEDDGYQFFYKGKKVERVLMSPDEYLERVRKGLKTKTDANILESKTEAIKKAIESGAKINAPFISTVGGKFSQEGRNRAVVARELGEQKIPVFIESDVTFDDKINRGGDLVRQSQEKGNTTKESVLEDIKKSGLHRDGVRFIEENYDAIQEQIGGKPKAAPSFTSSQSSEAATAFDKAKTSKGFDKKYGKGAYKALSDITKNFDAIMDKVSDKIKQDCL